MISRSLPLLGLNQKNFIYSYNSILTFSLFNKNNGVALNCTSHEVIGSLELLTLNKAIIYVLKQTTPKLKKFKERKA